MGREAANAFYTLANSLASLANASAQQAPGVEENEIVKSGVTPQQLMVLAQTVHNFGHQASAFPDPDSIGALSDRVNAKPGAFPLNVVVDQFGPLPADSYHISEIVEMGRLAQLPAAISSQEERERYLRHPLVVQGLPSNFFVQLAANEQSVVESVTFGDIARSLMDEEPGVFGTPEMREAFRGNDSPPFGNSFPPGGAPDISFSPDGPPDPGSPPDVVDTGFRPDDDNDKN